MKDAYTDWMNQRRPSHVLPAEYWCICSGWRTRVYAVGKLFISGGRLRRLVKHHCLACDRVVLQRLRTYPKHFLEAADA